MERRMSDGRAVIGWLRNEFMTLRVRLAWPRMECLPGHVGKLRTRPLTRL